MKAEAEKYYKKYFTLYTEEKKPKFDKKELINFACSFSEKQNQKEAIIQLSLSDQLFELQSKNKEMIEENKQIKNIISTEYPHIVDGINKHLSNLKIIKK